MLGWRWWAKLLFVRRLAEDSEAGMKLVVGPPASGKTTRLLEVAQSFLRQRKRVWWVCLPAQKAYVYRWATREGAVLGLEVLSTQQLYYRLLAAHLGLKPILTGPGRVALVGEALAEGGPLPQPGEARLFARAIAEAKRHGVEPQQIPASSPEARRLQRVYARYEELKSSWGRWDYDDFRSAALRLLQEKAGSLRLEADLVVVDGFRELSPLELRFFRALAQRVPLWLGLPQAPYGLVPSQVLPPRATRLQAYRAPNPVSEARWVLRSIKRDLALGLSPLEIAVVAPESRIPALLTLADEYGLPLFDQTAPTAAETPEGRLLLELLELPDYPTPTRLLAIPELAPLGQAALERGLVGLEATHRLAQELGLEALWASWLARLKPPGEEGASFPPHPPSQGLPPELAWAKELLEALPEVRHSPQRASLMERAREAHRIAHGADFRHWWAALLAETYLPHHPPGGVALLTPNLASGQRWQKLYLTYAVEGSYSTGEQEDYFIPEELRVSLEEALRQAGGVLPRRFLGRDGPLLQELQALADEVVVTYPEASQEGPLEPEPMLVGAAPAPLPPLPPASLLEVVRSEGYKAPLGPVNLGPARLEDLRYYSECGLRYWAERLEPPSAQPEWWRQWVEALRQAEKLVPARLEALSQRFPQAEGWMRHHYALLGALSLGYRLIHQGLEVRLDGVVRRGSEAHLYRFVAPHTPPKEAEKEVRRRWSERWAAFYLLSRYPGRIQRVHLWAWPVLGEPVLVYGKPIEKLWGVLERLQKTAEEVHGRYKTGVVLPKPGYHCRSCRVKDVCREGRRD